MSAFISLIVLLNVPICINLAESAPVYTQEPSNPSLVDEGDNITLHWIYNIDGAFRDSQFTLLPSTTIILKDGSGLTVVPSYQNRVQVEITASETTITLLAVSRPDSGNYRYTIRNTGLQALDSNVEISVQYKPENVTLNVNISCDRVCAGVTVKFTCTADANPAVDTYKLYEKGVMIADMKGSGVTTKALTTGGQFNYRCEANNSVGTETSSDTTLIVEAPVTRVSVFQVPASVAHVNDTIVVKEGDNVTLSCNVSENSFSNISWINSSNNELIEVGAMWALPSIYRKYTGEYKCIASNVCGSLNKTALIDVQYSPSTRGIVPNTTVSLGEPVSLSCPVDGNPEPTITWYKGSDASGPPLPSGEMLNFSQTMLNDSGCYTCSARNRFGGPVNASRCLLVVLATTASPTTGSPITGSPITGSPIIGSPITASPTTSKEPVCKKTFIKDTDCSLIVWKIVVLAIAGVVLIAFVVGIVGWWVHKRRKCRKDSRIHNSEERLYGNAEDNAYSQVNDGYAGTGPRPNGTEAVALQQRAAADGSDAAAHQQEAAAIPTYVEVDKSNKKKKAEEKLDYTYAEVDKSKKSKKKPKPGEMIYADLEDINVPRPMPTVSTSPQPLPPIKRPEPYENTQYADITQFLKGDATLPQSDCNQGTELQPQGANKDEGGAGGEDRNTPM